MSSEQARQAYYGLMLELEEEVAVQHDEGWPTRSMRQHKSAVDEGQTLFCYDNIAVCVDSEDNVFLFYRLTNNDYCCPIVILHSAWPAWRRTTERIESNIRLVISIAEQLVFKQNQQWKIFRPKTTVRTAKENRFGYAHFKLSNGINGATNLDTEHVSLKPRLCRKTLQKWLAELQSLPTAEEAASTARNRWSHLQHEVSPVHFLLSLQPDISINELQKVIELYTQESQPDHPADLKVLLEKVQKQLPETTC